MTQQKKIYTKKKQREGAPQNKVLKTKLDRQI